MILYDWYEKWQTTSEDLGEKHHFQHSPKFHSLLNWQSSVVIIMWLQSIKVKSTVQSNHWRRCGFVAKQPVPLNFSSSFIIWPVSQPGAWSQQAGLFLGLELWRLGYRETEKEFYCVVSAGQTYKPLNPVITTRSRKHAALRLTDVKNTLRKVSYTLCCLSRKNRLRGICAHSFVHLNIYIYIDR